MGTDDTIVLQAERREAGGSGEARRVRVGGKIPVVVYGEGHHDTLQVNAHDFSLMMQRHGEHQVLDLVVEGEPAIKVLVHDVQHDVRDGYILHADLAAISMDKPISMRLPIHFEGEAEGTKLGGVLELVLHDVEIECLPGNVVEEIPVDVTELQIGDSVTAGEIKLPEGLTLLDDPEEVLITIAQPTVEEEEEEPEEAAEGEAAAEEEKTEAAEE